MALQQQLFCPNCHNSVRLKVTIEEMYADFFMIETDKKLLPKLLALKATTPKIKLAGYFCYHCGKDVPVNELCVKDMASQRGKFRIPLAVNQFMLLLFGNKGSKKVAQHYIVHKENKDGLKQISDYMLNDGFVLIDSFPLEINNRKKVLT